MKNAHFTCNPGSQMHRLFVYAAELERLVRDVIVDPSSGDRSKASLPQAWEDRRYSVLETDFAEESSPEVPQ